MLGGKKVVHEAKSAWEKRMGTGSTLAGLTKLPIPNPFKYILQFRRTKL